MCINWRWHQHKIPTHFSVCRHITWGPTLSSFGNMGNMLLLSFLLGCRNTGEINLLLERASQTFFLKCSFFLFFTDTGLQYVILKVQPPLIIRDSLRHSLGGLPPQGVPSLTSWINTCSLKFMHFSSLNTSTAVAFPPPTLLPSPCNSVQMDLSDILIHECSELVNVFWSM